MISLRYRSDRSAGHDLFVKEHTQKRSTADPDMVSGKTIFVTNIPPYVHTEHLEFGFASAGEVSRIIIGDLKGRRVTIPHPNDPPNHFFNQIPQLDTFKSAYIVFKSTKAMRAALQLRSIKLYENNKTILETGVDKWTNEYLNRLPDAAELSAAVEEYMNVFDESEVERKQKEKQQEVDDDGWQVVKKGRNAGFEQKEMILKKLADKIEDGKKKKELSNFYTFQIRDSKQQHIVGLRRRFENDKRKIEVMKNNRRFKPY